MEPATALTLIRLSCQIITQIIAAAERAQRHKDTCNDFAKYLQDIEELLEIMTSELKGDSVTKNPLEKLRSLLQESYALVDSCKTIKVLDLLGGGIADKLKEKQSAIERCVTSFPCYLFVVAQRRERRKKKEQDKKEQAKKEQDKLKAINSYQALLKENITNYEVSWSVCGPMLEKRPLWLATKFHLDSATRERLFHEHVDGLHKRCVGDYRSLLAKVITMEEATKHFENGENILSSWSKAKRLLENRQRYMDMPKAERKKLLREHVDGLHKHCVGEYRLLLDEVITLDAATKHFENGENILSSWDKAKVLLKTRERYKKMPKGEREKLLREHVNRLHKLCVQDYRILLKEVITVDAATKHRKNGNKSLASWSEAKGLLKQHKRYTRMPKEEAETLFREHVAGLKFKR